MNWRLAVRKLIRRYMIWLTLLHLTLFKLSSFTLCRARRLTGHVVVHSGLILLRAEVLLDLLLLNQHGLLVGLLLLDDLLRPPPPFWIRLLCPLLLVHLVAIWRLNGDWV